MLQEQFARTQMLLGEAAMQRLAGARVAIFGIGGVGGYVSEGLARSGVGALDLIDFDTVSITNLNRQIIATWDTIGRYKVDVMAERIGSINPECRVNIHKTFYLPGTGEAFDFREYDYVVDAIDTVAGKLALVEAAKKAGTPIICAMGAGNKLDASAFRVADIYATSVCPLAKVIRRECRKRGIDSLKVVYSEEEPVRPLMPASEPAAEEPVPEGSAGSPAPAGKKPSESPGKRVPGSVAFAPSVMGLIIAGEVVKDLIK